MHARDAGRDQPHLELEQLVGLLRRHPGGVAPGQATATGARDGNPGITGLVAAATTYLVMLGVGAVGYALVRSDVAELLVFPAGYALSPFIVGAVVVALLTVVGGISAVRWQAGHPQEPQQPPVRPQD